MKITIGRWTLYTLRWPFGFRRTWSHDFGTSLGRPLWRAGIGLPGGRGLFLQRKGDSSEVSRG